MDEVQRNLRRLLPNTLSLFEQFLACAAVRLFAGSSRNLSVAKAHADPKDVPILAAAIGSGAPLLTTHNTRHFRGCDAVRVVRPSVLLDQARAWIAERGK